MNSAHSFLPDFSHIYIESGARDYPLTHEILKKFPRAIRIKIPDYKTAFNRGKQNFQIQKQSMKLILAVKKPPFIYKGSDIIQQNGCRNFYYNTPILNCLYNCDYCFLQGMYSSGNMVVFVNKNDFISAVEKAVNQRQFPQEPLMLSISYNTDLMAFENIVSFCRRWISYCRKNQNLRIEIRTKSALFHSLKDIEPTEQVILSWTLSPEIIANKYEINAPPPHRRLKSARAAIDRGWKIRLCFDPMLMIPKWELVYGRFIEYVFNTLPPKGVLDATVGLFRMSQDYFKRIKNRKPGSDLFYRTYSLSGGVVSPEQKEKEEMTNFMVNRLSHYLSEDSIAVWL